MTVAVRDITDRIYGHENNNINTFIYSVATTTTKSITFLLESPTENQLKQWLNWNPRPNQSAQTQTECLVIWDLDKMSQVKTRSKGIKIYIQMAWPYWYNSFFYILDGKALFMRGQTRILNHNYTELRQTFSFKK